MSQDELATPELGHDFVLNDIQGLACEEFSTTGKKYVTTNLAKQQ